MSVLKHGDVFTIQGVYRPGTKRPQTFTAVMPSKRPNPADLTTRNLRKTRADIATLRAQLKTLQQRVKRLEARKPV